MSYTHNALQVARDDIAEIQEKVVEGRREFFKQVGQGAVATAIATAGLHMGVRDAIKPMVQDAAADIVTPASGGWKNLFSLKPNYLYMNIGTTGSTPTQVIDKYEQWFYENAWECKAYVSTNDYCIDVAAGFGANPSEYIQSFTTTDGMIKTLSGLAWPWKPNSKAANVITSNMEHSGGLGPLYCQINKYNVNMPQYDLMWVNRLTGEKIESKDTKTAPSPDAVPAVAGGAMFQTPTGVRKNELEKIGLPMPTQIGSKHPDDVYFAELKPELDNALKAVGGEAQVLMFSSPPYLEGIRYPEKQMCQWAAKNNMTSSIDGAHLTGMININLHDMGVDMFAGSGHKWQCGPGQTGVAYIRNGKKGDEKWTFNNNAGLPVSGTAPEYTNGTKLPLFWAMNDTFRMSLYSNWQGTVRRPMVNGWRNPKDNVGQLVQSIGNNNIQMNRALYEVVKLWNTIGRQNIDDYVCTLAQYFRMNLANATWANGANKGDAANSLYALGTEIRKVNVPSGSIGWSDVWNPVTDRDRFPVYARCGLTAWVPYYFTSGTGATSAPDFDQVLSNGDSAKQSKASSAILAYMNSRYGIFTRNTSCPAMMRFLNPTDKGIKLSANATAQKGVTNHCIPFRWSTHLFHNTGDIDSVIKMWNEDKDLQGMVNLGATTPSA